MIVLWFVIQKPIVLDVKPTFFLKFISIIYQSTVCRQKVWDVNGKKIGCYWFFAHFTSKHIDLRISGNVSYNLSIDFTQLPMTHFGDSSWLQWLLQSPTHLRFIYPIGDVCQSYIIKSPPWTILWFRILGIFSVEKIKRLCVFMF